MFKNPLQVYKFITLCVTRWYLEHVEGGDQLAACFGGFGGMA
jgi:hypothetical protein